MAAEFEQAIARATSRDDDGRIVMGMLPGAALIVPSQSPVAANFEGFSPILFDRGGVPMLAVYTSLQRLGSVTRYAMTMSGEQVLSRMPPGVGLVVNPGHAEGFEMPPEGILTMRADLGSTPQRSAFPE